MSRGLRIVLAFIAGLAVGEGSAILGYIVATNWLGLFDWDGGGAMGAVFIIGPALAILFGFVAAIWMAMRTRAKSGGAKR